MTFGGSADNSTLYLNQGFTGVTFVGVTVSNSHSSTLTVKLYKNGLIDTRVHTQTINSENTLFYTIPGLSSGSEYYLAFEAPSNFSGNIK